MIFRFNNFHLDTDLRELRSGADRRVLEPQVFDLLLHLVKNRNRVVGKEELVQSVWGGRIVSDATINSRINAVRRALRDTGKEQSIIRTFPRRGIRFVAQAIEEPAMAPAPVDAAGARPEISSDRKPRLAILPFACTGDALDSLGVGLADAVGVGLSKRTGIEVISRDVAARLGSEPSSLASHSVDYVLKGTIQRSGTRLRVSAELNETRQGRQIWAERYDREMRDIIAMEDELAHVILIAVRWKIAAWDGQRIAEKTSNTVSTGDRLAQAARHFYTATRESYQRATVILDAVLQDEPRHPMALGMRAFALFAGASFGVEPLSSDQRNQAIRLAELALELQQGSDFLHWLRGTLALYLDCDHDLALSRLTAPLRSIGTMLPHCGSRQKHFPMEVSLNGAS